VEQSLDSAKRPRCLGRLLITPRGRQLLTYNSGQKSLWAKRQAPLSWVGTIRRRKISTKQESLRIPFINFSPVLFCFLGHSGAPEFPSVLDGEFNTQGFIHSRIPEGL